MEGVSSSSDFLATGYVPGHLTSCLFFSKEGKGERESCEQMSVLLFCRFKVTING